MALTQRLRNSLRRLHQEEEGLEALQVVMIVAIAAICLLLVKLYWPNISKWFGDAVNTLTGWKDPSEESGTIVQPEKR